jgi:hypothetical protein
MCEECRQHPRWKQVDDLLRSLRGTGRPPERLLERLRRLPSERKSPAPPVWKPILWIVFLLLWLLLQQIPLATRRPTGPSLAGLPRFAGRPVGPRREQPSEFFGLSRLNRLPALPEK